MSAINTKEEFTVYVDSLQDTCKATAYAIGIRRKKDDKVLDVYYPFINKEENYGTFKILASLLNLSSDNPSSVISYDVLEKLKQIFNPFWEDTSNHNNVALIKSLHDKFTTNLSYGTQDYIVYALYDNKNDVSSCEEAYFKLSCLSLRLYKPHELNLNGLFGKLHNIAWSNQGPILIDDVPAIKLEMQLQGKEFIVSHIDKFPYLVNYYAPSGVRIASGSQVRLGAYLGEGTTIMPAGYVNFNAGTLKNAMVEGRVSAGVFVDEGSDIGGGASIMGTLSGGNNHVISIGKNCLLGANSGTGISLGDGCTIAAGLYVYAGMKISLYNAKGDAVNLNGEVVEEGQNIFKGRELSGMDYLLFIQDSTTGKVICKPNTKMIELNSQLHVNT